MLSIVWLLCVCWSSHTLQLWDRKQKLVIGAIGPLVADIWSDSVLDTPISWTLFVTLNSVFLLFTLLTYDFIQLMSPAFNLKICFSITLTACPRTYYIVLLY